MASYQIEAKAISGRQVTLVTLTGHAYVASILTLLEELERRAPALVLVDETKLGVSLISPRDVARIAEAWRTAGAIRAARIAVVAPNLVPSG